MTIGDAKPCDRPAALRIQDLNDEFRRSFHGGRVVLTAGVAALPAAVVAKIVEGVKAFDDFDADNDPHGEHDYGTVVVDGENVFWKIDYYDRDLRQQSPDRGDPAITTRVLTIGLAADN